MIIALAIMVFFAIALSDDSIEGKGKQHFDNKTSDTQGSGIGLLTILAVVIVTIMLTSCSSPDVKAASDQAQIKFTDLAYWIGVIARIFWGIIWGYVVIKVGWGISVALSNFKISENVPAHYAPNYSPHYAPNHSPNYAPSLNYANKILPSPPSLTDESATSATLPTLDIEGLISHRRSILIIGLSGYGKSVTCQSILCSVSEKNTVFLHDPHDGAHDSLSNRMGIQSLKIGDWISKAEYIMSERKESRISYPVAIFAIDELNSVLRKDDSVLKTLESIAQEGRKYGVMALAVSHHPSAKKLGTEVRDSFGIFICHRIKKKTGYLIGLDDPIRATKLGVGEVLVLSEGGESLAKVEKIEKPTKALRSPSEPLTAPSERLTGPSVSPSESLSDELIDKAVNLFIDGKSLSEVIKDTWGVSSGSTYQAKSKILAERIRARLS